MYRNSYQRGMLTVLFTVGSKPLSIWGIKTTPDGYVTRFLDQDIKSMVVELGATNVSTTYIYCPKSINISLGISMPFLVMIVKNLKKYFSFEVTILDETHTRRRFRASNFQSTTQITPMCTVIPIALSDGWNQIQFNLAEFTHRAYKKQFVEVQRIKINANIRIRRIYFAERLLPEDQLPAEYKLFFPLQSKKGKTIKEQKEKEVPVQVIKPLSKGKIRPSVTEEEVEEKKVLVQEDAVAVVSDIIEVLDDIVNIKDRKEEVQVTPASEVEPILAQTEAQTDQVSEKNNEGEQASEVNTEEQQPPAIADEGVATEAVEEEVVAKDAKTEAAEEATTADETASEVKKEPSIEIKKEPSIEIKKEPSIEIKKEPSGEVKKEPSTEISPAPPEVKKEEQEETVQEEEPPESAPEAAEAQ